MNQIKEVKGKKAFEKAFKQTIYNFDETKIWFEHNKYETKVIFVLDGKLSKLDLYRGWFSIDIWKNYFIEYLTTGIFDYNGYWKLYENDNIAKDDIDKIYKFPLCNRLGKQFYPQCEEMFEFLMKYRKAYPNCGIKQVSKPNYEQGELIEQRQHSL